MKVVLLYCLEFLFVYSAHSSAKFCSEKLLDDRNKVPDSAFTESSYKDDFRGKWARESSNSEMAWCPKDQISSTKKEFLIIDLGDIYILKMIMTKGLSRHGFITASSYIIEYRRELNTQWIEYRERGVAKRIYGNKDHLTEKYESLDPSIIARWIKIYPEAENLVSVCLLIQIYGCIYSSNIMEYKMTDGNRNHNFSDYIYDGTVSNNYLSNGLGKLVTIVESTVSDPFNSDNDHLVGWFRENSSPNKVLITFRFDTVRNFTSVKIETSNYLSRNIKTFSAIQIEFSVDGITYETNQIIKISVSEDQIEWSMRFIITDLKHRVGKYLKIILFFRSDWIVIRRVEFNSVPSADYPIVKQQSTKYVIPVSRRPIIPLAENDFFSIPLAYTLVIVISILIIMLLIGIPCVTIFIRRQKNRNKKCKEALQRHYQEEQARFLTLSQQHFKDSIANPGLFTVSNFNPNANMNNRLMQESSIYTSLTGSDNESNCASDKQTYMPPNFGMINPMTNNRSLSNDYSATSFMTLGSNGASYVPYYSHNAQLARSQINLRSQYDVMNPISPCTDIYPNEITQITMSGPMQISIQGPVGNSKFVSTATPPASLMVSSLNQLKVSTTYSRLEFDNLKYINTIGRGNFGSIHIAEWALDQDLQFPSGKKFVCNEYNSLRESLTNSIETENGPNQVQEKQLASVKVLSKDAPTKIKKEFYQEIKYLMSLNHKNFVSVLNLDETSIDGCVVVTEYTQIDDLFSYLQCFIDQHIDMRPNIISQSKLLFIASQVASAMKHLESLQLVHCDLACRNVLVMNDQLLVKISDLAMSQQKFSSDYVPVDSSPSSHLHKSTSCLLQNHPRNINPGQNTNESSNICLLPIRWMCWQALIKGVFSNKSDVYSFGITLWELLTYCQKQPYHELTNEQVMINSNLQAHEDSRSRILMLPNNISNELVDFITQCTQSDENNRPTFIEIDMFLQHKTIGCQS